MDNIWNDCRLVRGQGRGTSTESVDRYPPRHGDYNDGILDIGEGQTMTLKQKLRLKNALWRPYHVDK